jgi:hypothetical protein
VQLNRILTKIKCQAVLHGSWASSLALLNSSLDITILEEQPPISLPDGYPFLMFQSLDTRVQKFITTRLKKVGAFINFRAVLERCKVCIANPQSYAVICTYM